MINPPIAIYYLQGPKTIAVHAHGPLYGVYGTQGLALMLFCLRAMRPKVLWKERWIWFAFWAINIGMLMEILLCLLPNRDCRLRATRSQPLPVRSNQENFSDFYHHLELSIQFP
jgi:nitric oxide reductase large subunit